MTTPILRVRADAVSLDAAPRRTSHLYHFHVRFRRILGPPVDRRPPGRSPGRFEGTSCPTCTQPDARERRNPVFAVPRSGKETRAQTSGNRVASGEPSRWSLRDVIL
ncbi:hypothetical protein EVAR_65646_1 [Eumeta japonica]|uniref:Uncharacterized protein n=1 Tax=Eumeta variegata TaxID=151549 RepID=A0A4C1Z6Q1_EUMVA|nr:hypothetical protein EVAR_65646_1 [Eumeta japonica]